MEKSIISVEKNLKINMWKMKIYCKIRDHCHYTGEYIDAMHSISSLKCSVLKKIPTAFHNGSNYDYHLIIEEWKENSKKFFIV